MEPQYWWEDSQPPDEFYIEPEEWDLGSFNPDPHLIVGKCYNCGQYVTQFEASSDSNLHDYCYESYRQYVMHGFN
jgi:hypothetical protein